MILESAFDDLMEEVGRQKLMDICTGKLGGEWLCSSLARDVESS